MAKLSVLPGGTSGGSPGPGRNPGDGLARRGDIRGWSAGSARRNSAFLWSVRADELPHGYGWALTLTTGAMPASAQDWHAARKLLIKRLVYNGATLVHWVVEWTRAGRPHLHLAVYGDRTMQDVSRVALLAWLRLCDKRGWPATVRAQHIVPIDDLGGWLEYLAKHASRGAAHYQRQGMPPGWEKTGRLWGTAGDWPVEQPLEVELTATQYHRYRRLWRAYQVAKYKRLGAYKAARNVGRRFGSREGGAYMGLSGWIPEHVSLSLITLAVADTGSAGIYEWES